MRRTALAFRVHGVGKQGGPLGWQGTHQRFIPVDNGALPFWTRLSAKSDGLVIREPQTAHRPCRPRRAVALIICGQNMGADFMDNAGRMLGEVLLQRLLPGKRQRPFTLAIGVQAEEREARCRCANRHSVSTVGPIARIRQIVPAVSPASRSKKARARFQTSAPTLRRRQTVSRAAHSSSVSEDAEFDVHRGRQVNPPVTMRQFESHSPRHGQVNSARGVYLSYCCYQKLFFRNGLAIPLTGRTACHLRQLSERAGSLD